jgi:hypothetical protein
MPWRWFPVYSQRVVAVLGNNLLKCRKLKPIPIVYEMLGGVHPRNCGAVRVVGDSMTDMFLYNSDLVIYGRSQM